jgi:hypothetical protein
LPSSSYLKVRTRYQEDGGCQWETWFQPELADYIRTFEELGGTAKYGVREHKLWKDSDREVDIITTYVRKYEYQDAQGAATEDSFGYRSHRDQVRLLEAGREPSVGDLRATWKGSVMAGTT